MARAALVRRESVETEMHKSEDKGRTFVYTKKRGYDVTRNPLLNKVSVTLRRVSFRAELALSCCLHVPWEMSDAATTPLEVLLENDVMRFG